MAHVFLVYGAQSRFLLNPFTLLPPSAYSSGKRTNLNICIAQDSHNKNEAFQSTNPPLSQANPSQNQQLDSLNFNTDQKAFS